MSRKFYSLLAIALLAVCGQGIWRTYSITIRIDYPSGTGTRISVPPPRRIGVIVERLLNQLWQTLAV